MIVESWFNSSTGVIGYANSEYDTVNNMQEIFFVVYD